MTLVHSLVLTAVNGSVTAVSLRRWAGGNVGPGAPLPPI